MPQPPLVYSVRGFEALFPYTGTLGFTVCLSHPLFLLLDPYPNVGLPSLLLFSAFPFPNLITLIPTHANLLLLLISPPPSCLPFPPGFCQLLPCPVHHPPPHSPWSSCHHLAAHPLHLDCLSLCLLPVWMNISSLTPFCQTSIQLDFMAFLVIFSF